MLNTIFDVAMLFGIASAIAIFLGAICEIVKYFIEKVFKINITAWLTSDDK